MRVYLEAGAHGLGGRGAGPHAGPDHAAALPVPRPWHQLPTGRRHGADHCAWREFQISGDAWPQQLRRIGSGLHNFAETEAGWLV